MSFNQFLMIFVRFLRDFFKVIFGGKKQLEKKKKKNKNN